MWLYLKTDQFFFQEENWDFDMATLHKILVICLLCITFLLSLTQRVDADQEQRSEAKKYLLIFLEKELFFVRRFSNCQLQLFFHLSQSVFRTQIWWKYWELTVNVFLQNTTKIASRVNQKLPNERECWMELQCPRIIWHPWGLAKVSYKLIVILTSNF